ncbi:MAG: hypothetical protein NZ516_08100 [Raineya sp.]|nr:hypothetical protein [Raineya sp.]
MDKAKKFLQQHQQELENFFAWENEERIWKNIEAHLENKVAQQTPQIGHKLGFRKVYQIAAVVILLLAVVCVAWFLILPTQPNAEEANSFAENPQLNQIEMYYTSLIEAKKEELQKLNPELLKKLEADFVKLDSAYQALKQDLSVIPNSERITQAMIYNLKLRVEILEQQIEILEKYQEQLKRQDSYGKGQTL